MNAIEKGLIAVLQEVAPTTTFILSWRNGVEPKSVYCLVMLLSSERIGRPEESFFNRNQTHNFSELNLHTVRLQWMGTSDSTASEDAETMKMVLKSGKGRHLLYQQGLSLAAVDNIKRAGVERETTMYMAHALDLTITSKQSIDIDTPSIDSASFTGGYVKPDDTIITTNDQY